MTDHTPGPCGCRVYEHDREGGGTYMEVAYCPTHAAAFRYRDEAHYLTRERDEAVAINMDLLAALKRIADDHPLILESDDATEVAGWFVSVAHAAISKARGTYE